MAFLGIVGLITVITAHFSLSGSWLDYRHRTIEDTLRTSMSQDVMVDARRLDVLPDFVGYSDLRDYCKSKGLQCSNYFWQISVEGSPFQYKRIRIYRRQGNTTRLVMDVSTRGEVEAYVSQIDGEMATLCSILYGYQRSMKNLYGTDKNFLARDEGQCNYDGQNEVFCYEGGNCIEKEVPCTNGWVRGDNFQKILQIAGSVARPFEFNNTNSALTDPACRMDRDLILIRREVQRGRYITACCGY